MIEYVGQINLPNQNIGQTGKTITANEQVRTCDVKALAKEVVHEVNNIVTATAAQQNQQQDDSGTGDETPQGGGGDNGDNE